MAVSNVPVLPHPGQVGDQRSIPPPPAEDFNASFGGVLPPAQTVESYLGVTTYYLIEPSHPSPSTTATPRNVVLIHGVGTPAIGLLPLAKLLAADPTPTTVLIYDNWGHGLSSTPVAPHVPGLFHTQILGLLAHLGWSRAHFLGFSLGGIIAASFAQYHTTVVQSLVLVAPAGLLKKSDLTSWERFLRWGGWGWGWGDLSANSVWDYLGPGPVEEGWEKKFKEKGLEAIPKEAVQIWEKEKHAGHVASLVSCYRYTGIYDAHDTYRSLAEGKLEILVLLGEKDGFFEKDYMQNELKSVGWKGDIYVVDGVGHSVAGEKPKEVQEMMVDFWEGLEDA
ncbi:unnamed protein product [Clonostachys rosea f. rosea IK726]|jgi:pimeloyl-ACP methyl ester carboxylesterase|uniref:Uncharacterized protein n=1 Tax=Clonostachys rosea f. rosea IK726 TaxID=1349383 RepID=A0ACA9U8M6_BIOOC|nr:unnamed protein product [Clonostachys rosea f. rosea IK726]